MTSTASAVPVPANPPDLLGLAPAAALLPRQARPMESSLKGVGAQSGRFGPQEPLERRQRPGGAVLLPAGGAAGHRPGCARAPSLHTAAPAPAMAVADGATPWALKRAETGRWRLVRAACAPPGSAGRAAAFVFAARAASREARWRSLPVPEGRGYARGNCPMRLSRCKRRCWPSQ